MTNLDMNMIAEEEADGGGQEGQVGAAASRGVGALFGRHSGRGGTADRRLSDVSIVVFDRGNKGYLDEVEQSARVLLARLAGKTGDVSADQIIAMKEEQRAMSKKTSKLVKSNIFMILLLISGSVGLGVTIMNGKSTVCICYYYFLNF
jgi:hypothetical protein